ncbi:type VII secretion protein EssA [Streptococcus cuniculi]|uniref:Type VII secretion protein EssA n=1 Tax=Streptococcus cuniculi TaxID=1432788 RepID=A0A4Y9JE88_9STRE|nr:type VII secretion protein EssA [Streptococcus cuniculi]MBF0777452.1 type VII secretion protein EssA [Streptococcus cuniculi]TFU98508.1 type VII secretion protein EssA [Streptococcus cuniculi]
MIKKVICIFAISLHLFSITHKVYADENGNLQLNPDIITNDTVDAGATSDFAIRGQLFLDDFNKRIESLKQKEAGILDQTVKIDFNREMTLENTKPNYVTKMFQNYQPKAVIESDETVTTPINWYVLGLFLGGVSVSLGGVAVGSWWSKRKRRAV